jgi:hypothetical protein
MRTLALFVGTCRNKKTPISATSGFVNANDNTFIHKHSVSHTSQTLRQPPTVAEVLLSCPARIKL